MSAKANIIIDQGSTFSTYINLTQDNGDILDLTGYTATGQIRSWYSASNYTAFNISLTNPEMGNIYLSLSANTTASLSPGRYVYDIDTIDSSNNVTRVVEGILTVTPSVTQLPGVTYASIY